MQAREEGATYEAASAGHGAPFTTKRVRGKCTLITRCRKHIGQYQLCVIVIKHIIAGAILSYDWPCSGLVYADIATSR